MTNILRRLEIVEKEVGGSCVIPEKERVVVIPFPADQKQEFERLKHDAMEWLKQKYGPNVSEADLLIVGIKKFARH